MSINAAPETVVSGALAKLLVRQDLTRIVVEVTEQTVLQDYASIARELNPLREKGLQLAVDDVGRAMQAFSRSFSSGLTGSSSTCP